MFPNLTSTLIQATISYPGYCKNLPNHLPGFQYCLSSVCFYHRSQQWVQLRPFVRLHHPPSQTHSMVFNFTSSKKKKKQQDPKYEMNFTSRHTITTLTSSPTALSTLFTLFPKRSIIYSPKDLCIYHSLCSECSPRQLQGSLSQFNQFTTQCYLLSEPFLGNPNNPCSLSYFSTLSFFTTQNIISCYVVSSKGQFRFVLFLFHWLLYLQRTEEQLWHTRCSVNTCMNS